MTKPHATGPRIVHERRQKELALDRAEKQEERRHRPHVYETVPEEATMPHRDPPTPSEYPRWADDGQPRPLPPAQPQGWVDPPRSGLLDDGYYVLEDPDPRVPFTGWESMRDRWDQAGKDPISHRTALIGATICALVIAIIVIWLAAPRPATTATVIPAEARVDAVGSGPRNSSGNLSSPSQTGAPQADPSSRGGSLLGDIGGAPPYRSGLTGPIYAASMTWCAPRGNQCTDWGGDARLAAVHSFRWGDEPYWVRIERGEKFADALVVSFCACRGQDGYIDVSRAVFRRLAPLSRGRVEVTVERLTWPYEPGGDPPPHPDDDRMRVEDGPRLTLPPTSMEDPEL